MSALPAVRCWAMTTGEAGMVSQAEGLAAATGLAWASRTVFPRPPWRWLPGHLCPGVLRGLGPGSDPVVPPWPDLLITCGRRSAAVSIALKRQLGARLFTVHVQNPRTPVSCFDLVVPPRHDGMVEGGNVVPSRVALHRLSHEKLAAEGARLAARFTGLGRPLVAVVLGGSSRAYRLSSKRAAELGAQLAQAVRAEGGALAVTPSRRTGAEPLAAFRQAVESAGISADIWDGRGDNPYFAMLALADVIVVTEDSASMVSEAVFTGKPVHVAALDGGNARFRRFHKALMDEGVTRPFAGRLERWSYEPVDETARIGALVREKLEKRRGAGHMG